jgi:hypothetical protein
LDASGTTWFVIDNLSVTWLFPAASTQPLGRFTRFGMIIAFTDDQTVLVFPDMTSVRGQCEAIDVEEGTYHFFDERGRRLKPRILTAVRRISLPLGVKIVGGGNFDLEPDLEDEGASFDTLLAQAVGMEPNRSFATMADLALHVDKNRRGKSSF